MLHSNASTPGILPRLDRADVRSIEEVVTAVGALGTADIKRAELRECSRIKDAERVAQVQSEHLRRACADLVPVLERKASA